MKKAERLIVTVSDDGIKEMADLTHPHLKDYAKWCDADFLNIDSGEYGLSKEGNAYYRKMQVGELLEVYERVLILDTDILINKYINLFDYVDPKKIGTILEDKGSRQGQRRNTILKIQNKYGHIGWRQGFINTGVFMVSKCHADIFHTINGQYWEGFGWDDLHLGYNIVKRKHEIQELDFRFNHMTMYSEPWNDADRWESFIIHYAGKGVFDEGIETRMEQMKKDYIIHKNQTS